MNAHVESGGPCTWRRAGNAGDLADGAAAESFPPCPCDAFAGPLPPEGPPPSLVDRERFLADAERAFRICYPERWEALLRAVERGWPTELPVREIEPGFQQISIEAPDEDDGGIQQVEIDARPTNPGVELEDTRPIPVGRTPGADFLARARAAISAQRWSAAFDALREAMNGSGDADAARELLARAWCHHCERAIPEPRPTPSTADFARFWRGRCPTCQSQLVFAAS